MLLAGDSGKGFTIICIEALLFDLTPNLRVHLLVLCPEKNKTISLLRDRGQGTQPKGGPHVIKLTHIYLSDSKDVNTKDSILLNMYIELKTNFDAFILLDFPFSGGFKRCTGYLQIIFISYEENPNVFY